jgi:DNA-binding transcriptional LysR family regulator
MMNEINLSKVDLNLLVLFEAVLEEKHVGRAARRLHLSASAVSHGIRRLRQTFNDPLFLKHPKGVVPTARAIAMTAAVEQVLAQVRQIVASADPFDPGRSKRRFVVGAPDALALVTLPSVLANIAKIAPGISLGIEDIEPTETIAALDARRIDVALYPLKEVPARFATSLLFEEDFVVAARIGHPIGKRVTIEEYCAAQHLLVSRNGEPRGFVDDILEQRGHARMIALTVPNFMFALSLIGTSDLIGTLPRRLVQRYAQQFCIAALESPLPFGRFPIQIVSPKAATTDSGVVWLVDLVQRLARRKDPKAKKAE